MDKFTRLLSTSKDSKSTLYAKLAGHLTHGIDLGHRKTFFFFVQIHVRHLSHHKHPVEAGALVAREEKRIGNTISMQAVNHEILSQLQFDKFSTPSSFLFWKIRSENQVTTCSDFPSEAMLWIREVEMVDSVAQLKSSRSTAGKNFPNFEMLDAKIASALNKIIQNSHVKKKVSLEEQDRFPQGRQIAFMFYDYFRVTGAHDTCSRYRSRLMFRNSIQDGMKFYYRRQRFHRIIFWKVYKLRKCEFDQLNTVSELHDMEIHPKISLPNYQKLKTMVKRSINQKLRMRNFDARHEKIERGAEWC